MSGKVEIRVILRKVGEAFLKIHDIFLMPVYIIEYSLTTGKFAG